jgi:hypothetical protein
MTGIQPQTWPDTNALCASLLLVRRFQVRTRTIPPTVMYMEQVVRDDEPTRVALDK